MLWEKGMFQSLPETKKLTSIGEVFSWALPGKPSGDVVTIKKVLLRGYMYYRFEKAWSFSLGFAENEINCLIGWDSLRKYW